MMVRKEIVEFHSQISPLADFGQQGLRSAPNLSLQPQISLPFSPPSWVLPNSASEPKFKTMSVLAILVYVPNIFISSLGTQIICLILT